MPIRIPKARRKQVKKVNGREKKFPFQSPKGMHDMLPNYFLYFDKVEKALKKVACFFDFSRIETPIMEDVRLYERGTGMTSEVVQKQMYMVRTRGDEALALRPEMTPGVLRAYIQNNLSHSMSPGRLYYLSPVFRYEQPQHGRYRQLYQAGFEILNTADPAYDAQLISATFKLFEEVKLKNVIVKINSIGCKTCRANYVRKLKEYYRPKLSKLCGDCNKRFKDNPLRMLDCKNEKCQPFKANAPQTVDHLCSACKTHFKSVLEFLDEIKIPYLIDSTLVRGLDYYSRTVFEVYVEGFDFALAGGGRYDYLSETLSGPRMPSIGVACGVERIIEAMKAIEVAPMQKPRPKVFLIYMGDQAKKRAIGLMEDFYAGGVPLRESLSKESLKSQLRQADKEGVDFALILGQREVYEDVIILRDMKSGNQENVPIRKIVEEVKRRI